MRTLILTSLCLLSSYFLSSQYDDSKHRLGFVSGFGGQNIDQLLSDMNHNDAKKYVIICFQKEKIQILRD
ncbi:MAG: hypothetical protein ACPH4K_05945 [Flavobacteriaceae bacterium]